MERQRRPRWVVWAVVAVQFTVPAVAHLVYLVTGEYNPFGWMMYST